MSPCNVTPPFCLDEFQVSGAPFDEFAGLIGVVVTAAVAKVITASIINGLGLGENLVDCWRTRWAHA